MCKYLIFSEHHLRGTHIPSVLHKNREQVPYVTRVIYNDILLCMLILVKNVGIITSITRMNDHFLLVGSYLFPRETP